MAETVLTEVGWYSRRTGRSIADKLGVVANILIAMDLPAEWWHSRKGASLGEWWHTFNRAPAEFKAEHGIEA